MLSIGYLNGGTRTEARRISSCTAFACPGKTCPDLGTGILEPVVRDPRRCTFETRRPAAESYNPTKGEIRTATGRRHWLADVPDGLSDKKKLNK